MLRKLSSVTAATLLIPTLLSAQSARPNPSFAPATVPTAVPVASSPAPASAVRAAPVGVRASRDANRPLVVNADTRVGAGQNVALMGVGAAAIVVGAIIGNTGGTLLAVGGAVVGLYGLYKFLQ